MTLEDFLERANAILVANDEHKAEHPDDSDFATTSDLVAFDALVELVLEANLET
jgi:hypothetical protein